MKLLGLFALAFALLGASAPVAEDVSRSAEALSTDRRVHGVITAVEPSKVTIATAQRSITGKIDPARTKVTIHGKPARLADLQLTAHARGELCLDDVWLTIDTH